MGKPFASEMALLPRTYAWALQFPVGQFAAAVGRARLPLLAVGSGGSYTAAHLACALHQRHFGLPSSPATPFELASTDIDLREAAALLLTAGGKNPDIIAAADEAVRREARRLIVMCATTGSELARRAECNVTAESHPQFAALIQAYYDDAIEDRHMRKGGKDARFGFGQCGLPLVLDHNTPNNTLALLWAETDGKGGKHAMRPLFRRRQRHS